METLSIGTVVLCISLWIRAKTVDRGERGNAERRALFVGLWPPTLWLAHQIRCGRGSEIAGGDYVRAPSRQRSG